MNSFFFSSNNSFETMQFQTNASSATTFDPSVSFPTGSKRVSWNLGDGSGYQATNSLSYVYTDSGDTKTVSLKSNNLKDISQFSAPSDNIVGNINMSGLDGLQNIFLNSNPELTGVSHTYNSNNIVNYQIQVCDISGNHDMSMFPNLGGTFNISINSNLTGITHTASTQTFSLYSVGVTNLTGNHDVSMLSNLGGNFLVFQNPNLTGISHTASSHIFTNYKIYTCNIIGNHDVSMFPNLGGQFRVDGNSNLTGITHTASTQVFTSYYAYLCGIIGNHDVSMFPNLGGEFRIYSNSNLTSITHTASTEVFTSYYAYLCNITGTHDISMLSNLGGYLGMYSNSNLTNILLPPSTQVFKNQSPSDFLSSFALTDCNLGYVDFNPLSGATLDTGSTYGATILLRDNSMTASDVNHMLFDFNVIATANPSGWAGVVLDISGSNAAPDGSSGGYDGTTAKTNLLTNGWTVTTT